MLGNPDRVEAGDDGVFLKRSFSQVAVVCGYSEDLDQYPVSYDQRDSI